MTRGAVRGAVALLTRGLGLQVIGFLAFTGLARLIDPDEFGLFAIAIGVQGVFQAVITAGLNASLVRQPEPPSAREQRAVAGLSMLLAVVLCIATILVGFVVLPAAGVDSTIARMLGISSLALPLFSLRMVPLGLMTRDLRFDRVALVDVVARTALYLWALPAAAVGLDVYALAIGIPVAALVSTAMVGRMQPWERGLSLDLGVVASHLRFGVQVGFLRLLSSFQLGLVGVFGIIGGPALSGFYGLSSRVLGLPTNAAASLQRVSFPALSRLAPGRTRTAQMAKGIVVASVGIGAVLAVLAGTAEPLIAVLFGERWGPAADILIATAPGLLLYSGMGTMIAGRALADGDVRSPSLAIGVQIAVTVAAAALLFAPLDELGVGIAMSAGYASYALVMLVSRDSPELRAASLAVARVLLVAALAAAAGLLVDLGDGLGALLGELAITAAVWLVLSLALTRRPLLDLVGLLRRSFRRGEPEAEVEPEPEV